MIRQKLSVRVYTDEYLMQNYNIFYMNQIQKINITFFIVIISAIDEDDELMFPCTCNTLLDEEGFGLCRKRDIRFAGNFSCFVEHPSSCVDFRKASEVNTKYMSAVACEDKNEGNTSSMTLNHAECV